MPAPPLQYQDGGSFSPQASSGGIDWRDYLSIIMERIWVAVTVLILSAVLSVVYLRRQTPVFLSTARIMVEDRPSSALNLQDVLSFNRNSVESFNTHLKALYSRKMIEGALEAPALKNNPAFLSPSIPADSRVDVALGYLKIVAVPQSRLIDILVEHPDRELAAEFANMVAEQYIRQDSELRLSRSTESMEWFKKQADSYRGKLEKGLLDLQEYRQKNNAVSLEENQDVVISTLKARSSALGEAENNRRMLESSWQSVTNAAGNIAVLGNLPMVAADPAVQVAQGALDKKRTEVKLLAGRYGPKFPEMVAAENEVKFLEQSVQEAVRSAAALIEAKYRSALAQEDTLRRALKEQEAEALQLDRKLVGYDQIKRNVEADKQIYEGMLSRMKEASLVGEMSTNYIRMVDPARPSKAPARPSARKILTSGIMFGLFLGIALSFAAHAMDNRLRRVDEVEKQLGHPVLASIPHIPGGNRVERGRVAELKPSSIPAEAFRTLRACLGLQARGREAKILLLTSVGVSDGKSLVASNLGIVLAQDNRKTILVDTDMRRPTVHRTYELAGGKESPGLSAVLRREIPWRDAIFASPVPGLDVMPAGVIPANPAELLGSSMMTALLADLAKNYDRVILDAPPAVGVSDPLVLLPRVDGVVFVVHFGKTRKYSARMAIQQIEFSGTPVLGTVVDNIQIGRGGGYHYYYYHRHSGYQYQDKLSSEKS